MRIHCWHRNSQLREGGATIWHQALAAGFVDGRARAVSDDNIETALTRGDGSGQSCGASANYENIRCSLHQMFHSRVSARSSLFFFIWL
jgi:hypothetical protein